MLDMFNANLTTLLGIISSLGVLFGLVTEEDKIK